jgi:glyoxylase-like metal-dependent hydrolase (beta-lactamase superfamily II)
MIAFCRAVLTELDADSIVIPGHGPVTDYADLARFTEMLQSVRDSIASLIDSGATLEQVIAAQPTAAWDEVYGAPAAFIDRAYTSLSQ